jgi:hypothetical protein
MDHKDSVHSQGLFGRLISEHGSDKENLGWKL